jgi:hypothetical protein
MAVRRLLGETIPAIAFLSIFAGESLLARVCDIAVMAVWRLAGKFLLYIR